MKISGLQKMTLLDYPGRIACTVFLGGCNFRCPFCHNGELLDTPEAVMDEQEFLTFLSRRKGLLDAVCISGGEPTLQPGLAALLEKIKEMGYLTKLDTNGSRPEILKDLVSRNLLDYVAMDIKNSPSRYRETCGGMEVLPQVRESAKLLMTGAVAYEFRTTVYHPGHTPDALREIGQWLQGAKQYHLQHFVDSGDLIGRQMRPLTDEEMEALRSAVLPYIPNTTIRGR